MKNKTESVQNIDTLENNKIVRTEIVTTYKESTDTILKILTRIENVDNDYKTLLLTGKKSEDGLSDWLIDSLLYNDDQFDTIMISYRNDGTSWRKNQIFKKEYDSNGNMIYLFTERFSEKNILIEEFCSYNLRNQIISRTRYECGIHGAKCDSVYKDRYYYNKDGDLDSLVMFIWKDSLWTKFKKK